MQVLRSGADNVDSRFGIDLIQKAATIVLVKDTSEAPWLVLKWLYILYLDYKNVSRLCSLHFKGARKIVDLGEVDVFHIVRAVIVSNLSSRPINTLDLDDLTTLNFGSKGYCRSIRRFACA